MDLLISNGSIPGLNVLLVHGDSTVCKRRDWNHQFSYAMLLGEFFDSDPRTEHVDQ